MKGKIKINRMIREYFSKKLKTKDRKKICLNLMKTIKEGGYDINSSLELQNAFFKEFNIHYSKLIANNTKKTKEKGISCLPVKKENKSQNYQKT
jgi:hypothetical protein